ncbi:hypothetical protein C2E23DRAFT_707174, partial [Lenzites betulinus]
VFNALTRDMVRWEQRGWLDVANQDIIQELIALLRERCAPTWIQWVKGHSGVEGNEKADALAARGVDKDINTAREGLRKHDARYLAKGAALKHLTQSLAYRAIRQELKRDPRKRTALTIARIQTTLNEDHNLFPKEEKLWRDLRRPEISRRASDFLWRCMHEAYKVGDYWSNIPGYEQRETCRKCEVVETMEHILTECDAPGRATLWNLANEALRAKGMETQALAYGAIIGAASLALPSAEDGKTAGRERFLRIVVSETAHLVWKTRCERVINRENEPEAYHSEQELQNAWRAAMNNRLRLDVDMTNKKWRSRTLPKNLVLSTWEGVLENEQDLPSDWIRTKGVLVG